MHHAAWVVAPLALVGVLGFSAVTKVGKGETLRMVVRNLELPDWVLPRGLARAVPGIELALAAGLLTPWRSLFLAAAAGSLVLMLTYWGLIARGLSLTPRPHCGCFGEVGDQRISSRTLLRNTLLVAAAAGSLAVGLSGHTAWSLLDGADGGDWLWLGLGALACVLTGLVLGGAPEPDEDTAATAAAAAAAAAASAHRPVHAPASTSGGAPVDGGTDDYVRTRTPALAIHDPASGPVTLQELSRRRAQLLVFVNCYCASTKEVMAEVPEWDARNEHLDVRLVFSVPIAEKFVGPPPPGTLLDHRALAWQALGLTGSPSAVLLGVDDHLAGGPVSGTAEVRAFVDDVDEALRESLAGTDRPTRAGATPLHEEQHAHARDTLTEEAQLTGDR